MNHSIDTNVLIVVSSDAAKDGRDVTPKTEAEQKKVVQWFQAFAASDEQWVVDAQGEILAEYRKKQTLQDQALVVFLDKHSRSQVIGVDVQYDRDGYALLPERLAHYPWDRSDKKFVAASLQMVEFDEVVQIVNASDTDWYDVANALASENIGLLQLIDPWCRAKYREQNGREPPP